MKSSSLSSGPSVWSLQTRFEKRPCALPTAGPGEVLIKTLFVSVDPYLRNVLNQAPLNLPLSLSSSVGEIIQSNDPDLLVGTHVVARPLPWRRYNTANRNTTDIRKIDTATSTAPLSAALGVLGQSGLAAFIGLFDIANFKSGDVVVVSGAAGCVGSLAGQLAKLHGAKKVIGIAGGPDKCRFVKSECGFDECIDYKAHTDVKSMTAQLKTALDGDAISVYFDNTGGFVTESIWDLTAVGARIAVCGQISAYNNTEPVKRPDILIKLIPKAITVRGFLSTAFLQERDRFYAAVEPLLRHGKLHYKETVYEGFDQLPEAFVGLFHGHNTGKAVVKVL